MPKSQFIPVLAIALEMCLATASHAQNPPMNCTPDGIIEVCTLVDSSTPQPSVEAVTPPAPAIPLVTYVNGQLTITAENVPLRDVLREVSRKTGATVEVPAGTATEAVFTNIGPGPVRDVLSALLNGSRFNYVIAGLANSKSGLDSIVLTPAQASSSEPQTTFPAPQPAAALPAPGAPATHSAYQFDPAEVERARQEAMANAQQEREEQEKQGTAQPPGPSPDSAN